MRRMIVHYIYQNASTFVMDIQAEGYPDPDAYCNVMSRSHKWGDGVCVQAFGLLFKINVWMCYDDSTTPPTQLTHFEGRPHIGLMLQNGHYDRVLRW